MTLLLAYSRGSLLALGVGCVVWFAVVPLRLRGVAVLAVSGLGGGLVALWAFGQNSLSKDSVALTERATGGHQLGILLVAMVLGLLAAGLAIGFALARRAPSPATRRQAGIAVLAALAIVPLALAGALALSQRGLGGSISKGFNDLTNVNASTPTNAPNRLTAVGSVRARYWNEALKIFKANKAIGVGAGGYATVRLRYRNDQLDVRHAHGYVVQTLADLGLAGLLASLALLAAWLAAAGRTIGLTGAARRAPWGPERIGMATLLAICVVFGVHSFVDWTWFVPGNAIPAMLCAGWLAGRGPVDEPVRARDPLRAAVRVPWRVGLAVAAVLVGVLAAWTAWQPQRAVGASYDALSSAEARDYPRALHQSQDAQDINPLSIDTLFDTAAIELAAGRKDAARATLQRAVRREPANPEPWLRLAQFELAQGRKPQALSAVGSALYLDPRSPVAITTYLEASRRVAAAEARRAHVDVGEARVGDDLAQGPRAEEAQMVGARIEVAVGPGHQARVPRRRGHQRPAPAQHAADLGEQADDVGHVLERLAGPHHVEGVLGEGQRRALLEHHRAGLGHPPARAANRLAGHVGHRDDRSGPRDRRRERAVPAAQVEHAVARRHVREQERPALGKALGLGALGHRAPHVLAPVVHRAGQ